MSKKFILVVALVAMVSLFAATVSANQAPNSSRQPAAAAESGGVANYIVQLDDAPLALYNGGVAGLAATSAEATGAPFNLKSPASTAYVAHLVNAQAELVSAAAAALGRDVTVVAQYQYALNGVVLALTPAEAAVVADLSGVKQIAQERMEQLLTDAGPEWIGALNVWDGSATGTPNAGEGTVIADLDTGINFDHPSFADPGPVDGYDFPAPLQYFGVCDPGDPQYNPAYTCNDKLIGAFTFVSEAVTPEDSDGHGSHTASTAAGNIVDAVLEAPTITVDAQVKGVAPHAHVIAMDVCVTSCPTSSILNAINKVVELNGLYPGLIDVINFSISGGPLAWGDSTEEGFLAATATGVFVSASAGNNGPGPSTAAHRSPWLTSVAAATSPRTYETGLVNMSGGGTPPGDMVGRGITAGYGPETIVYAGDYDNGDPDPEQCFNPFPPGTWNGEIVVCDRGTIARVDKGANVLAGGAGGFVLANSPADGESTNADPHFLPAAHVGYADGVTLKAWIAGGAGHMATIPEAVRVVDGANADHTAGFSSRGPNTTFDTIIPDVMAPGVDIYAAVADGLIPPDGADEFDFLSGTSMASPHNAGTGLLLRSLYPNWSPAQIQSALMTTSVYVGPTKEDNVTPADPFDMGAGRVQVDWAAQAGLLLNETIDNFTNADPDLGGDPRTLNIASMANSQCVAGNCFWTRTVEATVDGSWTATSIGAFPLTIEPTNFSLLIGETQVLTITADASGETPGDWAFANVILTLDQPLPRYHPGLTGGGGGGFSDTSNPNAAIPDDAYDGSFGSMACDMIDASSIPAGELVSNVTVSLGATHTWIGDVVTKLQSPDGSILGLYSRPGYVEPVDDGTGCCGDSSDLDGAPLLFDDASLDDPETMGNTIGTGDLVCTTDGRCDYYPNPGAVVGHSSFADFAGENASGMWMLCMSDSAGGDTGTFMEWTLNIEYGDGGGGGVPEAHLPVAVVPVLGELPVNVNITTRRDAGSWLVPDNTAIEITDLTSAFHGPAPATITTEMLSQDPTNGDPYDNLNDGTTFWTTVTVNPGDLWFVAQVTASEAPDVDMYVGLDTNGNGPEPGEELCASAGSSWTEICEFDNPTPGDWWVLVQNWTESANPPDVVTLATAVVPEADAGLMWVEGPPSVPAGELFDLRVFWDGTGLLNEGDVWYGIFDLGTDPGNPANLGTVPVTLSRVADDVTKSVDNNAPDPGDTLTYTIQVQPNVTNEEQTYTITDIIPAGLTYVPGSATASIGTVDVTDNQLTWSGTMIIPGYTYQVATSDSDPVGCAAPLATDGAYVDLELYGITTDPGVFGDTVDYFVNPTGGPFSFFGQYQGENLHFTDDGFAFFEPSTPGAEPWLNEPIPTASDPNNLMAMFWRDMEIVYDGPTNRGVTIANLTSGGQPSAVVIEYDDVEDWPAGSNPTYDFEIVAYYEPDPGRYEYIFAYDNLTGDVTAGTIGVENADGSAGVQHAYNDIAVADGMAVCFDFAPLVLEPATITYQVTVDADACGQTLTNELVHNTDNPGAMPVTIGVDVTTTDCPLSPAISLTKTVGTVAGVCAGTSEITVEPGTDVYYCYTVENTGDVTLSLHDLTDSELGDIFTGYAYDLTPGGSLSTVDAGLEISATIMVTTTNTAVWTAYVVGGPSAVAEAAATVNVEEVVPPVLSIDLSKTVSDDGSCGTATNLIVTLGATVTYCYTVTNTGGLTLTMHMLTDTVLGEVLPMMAYDLAPGASYSVTASMTPTQTGTVVNDATWTAYSDDGVTTATAQASITVEQPTDVSLSSFDGSSSMAWGLMLIVALMALFFGAYRHLRRRQQI